MTISTGVRFNHYETLAPLGAGGMGEVWRARDTHLNREVAIKVLPADFAKDAERLRRFEQEALATSALNHPNILTIYEFGTHEGAPYIVTELLEGEELRAQLDNGALPVRRAIEYAQQVAAGLAAAHEKGITHRDLKPENLFVTKDGRVKILDFGLAKLKPQKLAGGVDSQAPTLKPLTSPGVVMGTVGYMSPEQVRGQEADHRSDIFSFGIILNEMLSGQRTFSGDSLVELMNAILKDEPADLSETNAKVSPQLDKIVRRCLEKKPEQRFQTASDLGFALNTLTTPSGARLETATALPTMTESLPAGLFGKSRLWMAVAAVMALGLLAALPFAVKSFRQPSSEAPVTRLSINLPKGSDTADNKAPTLALSPDGRRLVFHVVDAAGKLQLWLRPLDSFTSQPLAGTEMGGAPFWSPDGRYIGFFADNKLKKLDTVSGVVEILWPEALPYGGGTWNQQGVILFKPGGGKRGLWRINAAGGQPESVPESVNEEGGGFPSFLPDGKHYLFFFGGSQIAREQQGLYVGSLDGKVRKMLLAAPNTVMRAVWAAPGYILYSPDRSTLVARAFDSDRLEWQGEPFRLADNIIIASGGTARFAVSANGVLAYLPGVEGDAVQLTWRDRSGKRLSVTGPAAPWAAFSLSADERFALLTRNELNYAPSLWLLDLVQGTPTNFRSPSVNRSPVWSPDGKQFVWAWSSGFAPTLYLRQIQGNTPEERLGGQPSNQTQPTSWSPDGSFIVFMQAPGDLWVMPMTGERKPQPLLQTKANEQNGRISPDGKWLAYQSDEAGSDDIYVTQFPQPARSWRISKSGGVNPHWRGDGKELYFVAGNKLMAVSMTLGTEVQSGTPQSLFEIEGTQYEPSKDGQRLLTTVVTEKAPAPPINVVLNWTAEVKH
jgi:serine/threonine protein kinase/Tol biopolymer transport system component